MLFMLDYGDHVKVKTLAEVEELYAIRKDKWDFSTFEEWLKYMLDYGFIREI